LEKLSPDAKYVGTDKDIKAFEHCAEKFKEDYRVQFYNTSFLNIDVISRLESIEHFDAIFVDLGVSSVQLDSQDAGFTYRQDSELDLRMDKKEGYPAYKYLNELSEQEIANILFNYGEEKKSRQISREIVRNRQAGEIKSSFHLNKLVEKVVGGRNLNKSLSRVYQALRIYVNNELDDLKIFLKKSVDLLAPGGKLAVISFHSLEDRIVKEFFRYESLSCVCPPEYPVCICNKKARVKILTKRPVVPSENEISNNPRSRSSKLRVAERI
jgi:16S rRNA (cytosine1402-N4)-methyltransferase